MPTRFGPYRVQAKLSEGAVAALFTAEHESLGRTALIKALKASIAAGSPLAAHLVREARVLGRLSHPSIIALLDFTRTPETIWMVLEDARGPSLAEVLRRAGKLAAAPATAIALAVAEGLGHAHARGVVHRDVRPEGMALLADGRVKLVDLGMALDLRAAGGADAKDAGDTLLGPEYAAPEQILGEAATARSDVFALGVVLYEMLSGARPWGGGEAGAREVARRVRSEEAPPLGKQGVLVPRSLERVVERCLAKRPEERFEDGAALAEALAEVLDEQTALPTRVLVTQALAAAGLGEAASEAPGRRRARPAAVPLPLGPLVGRLLLLLGLMVAGGAGIELFLREDEVPAPVTAEGTERGYLRVLSRPWAEVLVDGQYVDVTPMARAIPVLPGRHYVTFKHPNAPDEKREVRVAAGQTVLLDVTMRVERPVLDGGADAAGDADTTP